MTNSSNSRFSINAPAVACQILDGEAILIHFDRGDYFSAAGSGAFLLAELERGASEQELAAALAARFSLVPERARACAASFIAELVREELVIEASEREPTHGADPASAAQLPATPSSFDEPRLVKYSDLQDLLVLDPIHDVVLGGWPSTAP